ncbi:MAG TPA: hypothetical protein VFP72_12300 [Kineosporiaceae bacterium]|nr:hypothetical protein [Kineosporiaceae bacterium]
MAVHAFVDESTSGRYLLVTTLMPQHQLDAGRQALRALQLPGQRRIHFQSERDSRRRQILGVLCGLPLQVWVRECGESDNLTARLTILSHLVPDLIDAGCTNLVLESDDSIVVHDERAIRAARVKAGIDPDDLTFHHLRPYEEPLLWASDAVAWAWRKGGSWRAATSPIVASNAVL